MLLVGHGSAGYTIDEQCSRSSDISGDYFAACKIDEQSCSAFGGGGFNGYKIDEQCSTTGGDGCIRQYPAATLLQASAGWGYVVFSFRGWWLDGGRSAF